MRRAFWLGCALIAGAAAAHEVQLQASQQAASVLRLSYADGQPFAFEAYELYLPGRQIPEQVGRTNRQGQLIFLPGGQTQWRLKAYSADGHGLDKVITVRPDATDGAVPAAAEPPRWLVLAAGLGIVFGLFGFLQLFLRKKPS